MTITDIIKEKTDEELIEALEALEGIGINSPYCQQAHLWSCEIKEELIVRNVLQNCEV